MHGKATISKNAFTFDSCQSADAEILENSFQLNGSLFVSRNGCAEFHRRCPMRVAPSIVPIAAGLNYFVKRTSVNYLVMLKVPVQGGRDDTQHLLEGMLPQVMTDITLDRKELKDELFND